MLGTKRSGILLALAVLVALSSFGAGEPTRSEAVGSIVGAKGSVLLDQEPVLPGVTVFGGDVLTTGSQSGAILNLLSGTAATLVENAELKFSDSTDSSHMTLNKGAIVVRSSGARPARVEVPGALVTVQGEGDFPSICRIAAAGRSAVVIVDKGYAEIHGTGAPTIVRSGNTVHLEAGVPQVPAGSGQAGTVKGLIPTAYVQRGAAGATNPLKLADAVYWRDEVETNKRGRVRIKLEGVESFLNVGAGAKMQILSHDPKSQQTVVQLTLGKLQENVAHLTKGGKFETRTPTAVIGVVGTVPLIQATPRLTRVWSQTGDVTVRNINPRVTGFITLHSGQFTAVHFGLPPSAPVTVSPAQIQNQASQTNVQSTTTTTAGTQTTTNTSTTQAAGGTNAAGGANASAVTNAASGARSVGTVAASGASAGAGGAAISSAGNAQTTAASAATNLSAAATANTQAAATANSAATAAGQAANATTQAQTVATTTATTTTIAATSGCGCVSPTTP